MEAALQHEDGFQIPKLEVITAFLVKEARLLDERRFEEWMALFADEGVYWAPTSAGQESPLSEVSIFYDDRVLMGQRITRLRHDRIHVQSPPSRTVHLVVNPEIAESDPKAKQFTVLSKFLMVEYRPSVPEGMQRLFAGDYRHTFVGLNQEMKIVEKKATLVNCDAAFSPIALYF